MPPDAPAADSEFLTIDQAVANLDAADQKEEQAPATAAAAETPNTEAEPAAEDTPEPETAIEGDDAETEEGAEEAEEAELPAIEPPALWSKEDKDAFLELPRHLQERLLARETESNRVVSKKFEEAAALRKAADIEASKLTQLTAHLDKLIPEAEQTFATNWGIGEIDWNRVAQEHGVERAFQLKNDHDRQLASIQQLKAAKDTAENVTTAKFKETRAEQMRTVVPDLADAKEGPARQIELVNYLASQGGVDPQVIINRASAKELAIGWKAYLYDKLNADAKTKAASPKTPAQPKPATPARPSVKPTAAPARAGSPQSARIQALQRKTSLTTDELVELMDLQGT